VRRASSRKIVVARLGLTIAFAACSSSSGPPANQGSSTATPVAPTTPDARGAPAPSLAPRCEQALRNFTSLVYWAKADPEIAALPPAERGAARAKKLSSFTEQLERELPHHVRQCEAADNAKQVDCMIAAKTAEAARACMDTEPEH